MYTSKPTVYCSPISEVREGASNVNPEVRKFKEVDKQPSLPSPGRAKMASAHRRPMMGDSLNGNPCAGSKTRCCGRDGAGSCETPEMPRVGRRGSAGAISRWADEVGRDTGRDNVKVAQHTCRRARAWDFGRRLPASTLLAVALHACAFLSPLASVSARAEAAAIDTATTPSPSTGQAGTDEVAASLGPLNVMTGSFSESVAVPIKGFIGGLSAGFYSPGFEGSPRAFFSATFTGQDIECEAAVDGTACAYASFFVLITVLFAVILPVLTTVYCASFCCARTMVERCQCCCALCKQENCGGHRPTGEYDLKEKVCCSFCLVIMVMVFVCLSIIGFLSTMQVSTDFRDVITGLKDAIAFPEEMRDTINASFKAISVNSVDFVDDANAFTLHRDPITTASISVNTSIDNLITKWQNIGKVVEGETSSGGPNTCKFFVNDSIDVKFDGQTSMWTYSQFANFSNPIPLPGVVCCEAVNHTNCVRGIHPAGRGVLLPSTGQRSPTCSRFTRTGNATTKSSDTCPCCCTCQQNIEALQAVKDRLPTADKVIQATPQLNKDALSALIEGLGRYVVMSVDSFEGYMTLLRQALDPVDATLGDTSTVVAGAASGWCFAMLGPLVVLIAWLMVNVNCWWVGYFCGFVTFLMMTILFGVTSALVLPFDDLCDGLPVTGFNPDPWLITFSPDLSIQSVDPTLRRLHQDCLVLYNKEDPSLWNVAGYSRQQVEEIFGAFDVAKIVKNSTAAAVTDTQAHTLAFSNLKAAAEELDESSILLWGGWEGLSQEALVAHIPEHKAAFDDYRLHLKTQLTNMKASIVDVEDKQTHLIALSSQLDTNLTKMKLEATTNIKLIADKVIQASNCSYLNELYMGIRRPTCQVFHVPNSRCDVGLITLLRAPTRESLFLRRLFCASHAPGVNTSAEIQEINGRNVGALFCSGNVVVPYVHRHLPRQQAHAGAPRHVQGDLVSFFHGPCRVYVGRHLTNGAFQVGDAVPDMNEHTSKKDKKKMAKYAAADGDGGGEASTNQTKEKKEKKEKKKKPKKESSGGAPPQASEESMNRKRAAK